ncbi:MAG: glycosyltransferase family 4 protein [Candidatus Wallbacteria bacterium]|nr:glycosyltransferase family 4 protein [Candidatus Wallbacteria bacterium]
MPHHRKQVCFYAPVPDKSYFHYNEFYNVDRRILEDLGFEVTLENSLAGLCLRPDLWFIWWWTRAAPWTLRAQVTGSPLVITGVFNLDLPLPPSGFRFRPMWQQMLIRSTLRTASANVFVSRQEYERMTSLFSITRPSYIPLTVDTSLYQPGDRDREPLVVTVAWMEGDNSLRKGVPQVLQIFSQLRKRMPSARLVIAGERGSAFASLEKLAAELNCADAIDFPGRISTEDKIRLLQRASLYLQPAIFEGFGVAVAEAMSCGVPVLTSPAGALPELVGDSNLTIALEDSARWLEASVQLMQDRELWKERSRSGRERIEREFSYERRLEGLRSLFRDLRVL